MVQVGAVVLSYCDALVGEDALLAAGVQTIYRFQHFLGHWLLLSLKHIVGENISILNSCFLVLLMYQIGRSI